MLRFAPVLMLLVACGQPAPEAAAPLEVVPEVEMEAAELMIPASQAEMLEEEILALREETARLKVELEEAKTPSARKVVRHAMAVSELANAESELRRLRSELAETQERLARSEARNGELTVELEETEQELAQTTADLELADKTLRRTRLDLDGARRIAADAGWSDLVAQTQVALCPKGGRKKMESCRAGAIAAIAPVEPAARACLRSGQAAPQLQRAGRGEDMPRQAIWVGESGDDFYVVLCDPTLPEARELIAARSSRRAPVVDEPDKESVETRMARLRAPAVAKASYEPPQRAAKPRRAASVDDEPELAPDVEPDEPTDLLADDDGLDLALLGLMDLDGDSEADAKPSRDERKKAKKEREDFEAGRRTAVLDGAGDDLLDEDF